MTVFHCGSYPSIPQLFRKVSDCELSHNLRSVYLLRRSTILLLSNPANTLALYHWFLLSLEHEACSRDITELKWQLKLENQKIDEVQEKLFQAELLIRKLQEDIEFARNQMPIVKENSDRQKDVIHLLQIAQTEVCLSWMYFSLCPAIIYICLFLQGCWWDCYFKQVS